MSNPPVQAATPAWFIPPAPVAKKLGVIEDGMDYDERLLHYTYATQQHELHFMEFRILQRLNIFRLQNRLARLKGNVHANLRAYESDADKLEATLHSYGKDFSPFMNRRP